MKTEKNILVAFLLNLFFSVIEFVGGIFTGSVAIISDSIHDLGDAISIGMSFFFEKISLKKPDDKYTYGYYRYSVLGGVIQSVILLCGSIFVVYNAVLRFINPIPIDYSGMIVIAIIGFIVNFIAAYFTKGEGSINQKAINLHLLEDVFGWAIVLIGAVVMKFTGFSFLDPLLSVLLAVFIMISSLKNLKAVLDIFLEKTPANINIPEIKKHLAEIDGITDIHHLHIWSMDGYKNSATLHVVTNRDFHEVKEEIKHELNHHGIAHVTIECETPYENCHDTHCEHIETPHSHHLGHHHH